MSDRHVTHSDLVEIAKQNGDFRKNYGLIVGAILYLRSINAARPRLFWWQTLIASIAVVWGLWWRQMARSKENWAAFFKRSDRKKKIKSRKLAPSLLTVGGRVPHVIGELISVRSDRPIHKSHILTFSAKRRAHPTGAEAELQRVLNSLNGGALRGKFKREHIVSGKWIVDFFFPEIRLAIEVDGSAHNTQVQRLKDLKKDSDCRRFDITVLRLRNAEIFGDRDWLIKKLRAGWREAKDRENRIIGTSA